MSKKFEFTDEDIKQAEKYYCHSCSSLKEYADIWSRCEICGAPLMYDTSVYCMNECKSQKYKDYRDEDGNEYEARFCWDCLEKIDGCPICGSNYFGR